DTARTRVVGTERSGSAHRSSPQSYADGPNCILLRAGLPWTIGLLRPQLPRTGASAASSAGGRARKRGETLATRSQRPSRATEAPERSRIHLLKVFRFASVMAGRLEWVPDQPPTAALNCFPARKQAGSRSHGILTLRSEAFLAGFPRGA